MENLILDFLNRGYHLIIGRYCLVIVDLVENIRYPKETFHGDVLSDVFGENKNDENSLSKLIFDEWVSKYEVKYNLILENFIKTYDPNLTSKQNGVLLTEELGMSGTHSYFLEKFYHDYIEKILKGSINSIYNGLTIENYLDKEKTLVNLLEDEAEYVRFKIYGEFIDFYQKRILKPELIFYFKSLRVVLTIFGWGVYDIYGDMVTLDSICEKYSMDFSTRLMVSDLFDEWLEDEKIKRNNEIKD